MHVRPVIPPELVKTKEAFNTLTTRDRVLRVQHGDIHK